VDKHFASCGIYKDIYYGIIGMIQAFITPATKFVTPAPTGINESRNPLKKDWMPDQSLPRT